MELVERDGLLAELHALLDDARAGSGRIVFVGGEAGVGKTSVVRAFCADLSGGVRVPWGACDPLSTPRPLGPFHDMASSQASIAAALERPGRHERHTALLDELALLTVMVVEDAHWSDEATLDALRFLGRRVDTTRGLLVVTFRDDELDLGHLLRAVLGDLATAPGYRRLDVPVLTPDGVAAVVGDSGVDVHRLYDVTDGNPFFVTEALAVPEATVPVTVSDAVLSRAGRLSPQARGLLGVASLAPGGLEPTLAAMLVDEAEAALDECTDHGILLLDGARMTFRHELARLAVEGSIPAARRRRLHRQLVEHLEALPGADPARLVHHADVAGDTERVLRYAPLAAREASAGGAHREAAAHYGRAVARAEHLSVGDHAELISCWADERAAFDAPEEIAVLRMQAIELHRQGGDRLGEGAELARLCRDVGAGGRPDEAEQIAARAIELLEPFGDSVELADAYSHAVVAGAGRRHPEELRALASQAIELAERVGAAVPLSRALSVRGEVEIMVDQDPSGVDALERSREIAVAAGDDLRAVVTDGVLGGCLLMVRKYADARRSIRRGLDFARERDVDWHIPTLEILLAQVDCDQGRWTEAEALMDAAL